MERPVLVVMAAGMGSRYGGLKQLDPVGPAGEVIMDFSLYDARKAGFEKVIFIIKHSIEDAFREQIGNKVSGYMETAYAFQDVADLPAGYDVPEGREKPWGTAHAILAARDLIRGPFAVINADDYYGPEAFQVVYDFLAAHGGDPQEHFCMAGFLLKNTVTENGTVARGICRTDAGGHLISVQEMTKIGVGPEGIRNEEADGSFTPLAGDTLVSMNLWGFTRAFVDSAAAGFPAFLDTALRENPMKGEYYLPSVVTDMLAKGLADVAVLTTHDKWHGVTYQADKADVIRALQEKTDAGLYPSPLWQ